MENQKKCSFYNRLGFSARLKADFYSIISSRIKVSDKGFETIKNSNDLSYDAKVIFLTTKFTKLLLIKNSQNLRDNTNTMVQKYFGRIISTTNGITQIKSSSK